MHTLSKELFLKTTDVAYFKKWLMNQNNIYSIAQITYTPDVFLMHGTSVMENIMLCNTLYPSFFDTYRCLLPKATIEMNMFHLYKIIGRASSFRYNSIVIQVFDEKTYKIVSISFETDNKKDEYHIRCQRVHQTTSRIQQLPNKKEPYVNVKLDGAVLCSALSKFEADIFQKISFALKLNQHKNAMLYVGTDYTQMLALRGKTEMIKGNVCIPIAKHSNNISCLKNFKKSFSLESLSKCIHFYHLAIKKTIHLVFYLQSNVVMLIFHMKNKGRVEVLLPPLQDHRFERYSSSSDSE